MKKLLFFFFAFALSISMQAQISIGGDFVLKGQSSKTTTNGTTNEGPATTQITVLPNAEYMLEENFAVGGKIGFNYARYVSDGGDGDNKESLFMFHIAPYARMYFPAGDKVSLFGEGGIDFASGTEKISTGNTTEDGDTQTSFSLGLRPGMSYKLTEKFSLEFTTGFIGYNQNTSKNNQDPETKTKNSNYGVNINLSTLNFGIKYSL